MTATEVIEIIGLLLFGTGSGIVGSILYFKPQLQKQTAEAKIAEIEAEDKRHDYLEERISNMEKMYNSQGEVLDDIRSKYITLQNNYMNLQNELSEVKLENLTLRNELDAVKKENLLLTERLDRYNHD